MSKPTYIYHIITAENIEEKLQKLQVYPTVHYEGQDETCLRCNAERITQKSGEGIRAVRSEDGGGGERGDIPEGRGMGNVSENDVQKLCPGPEGVIESEKDGGSRIRWRNGRKRRYSIGRGSRDGETSGDDGVGKIHPVGAYTRDAEGTFDKIYNGPFKLVAVHFGPRGRHWHLVYISSNKQWGFNSRLGRLIRLGQYKNKSVDCLTCLREYLYSGDGRQVLQDVLSKKNIKACQCAEHRCGMDSHDTWKTATYEAECSERGDTVLRTESGALEEGIERVVDAVVQTDDGEAGEHNVRPGRQVRTEAGKDLDTGESGYERCVDIGETNGDNNRNANIIILLCNNGTFTEGDAMAMFAKSGKGINLVCSKQYAEKIRTYIHVARVLVFQESLKQRFERAKSKFATLNPGLMNEEVLEETRTKLLEILHINEIDEKVFFESTFKHFTRQSGKQNNLFFLGPPSTGKTMIMASLVECHFNFCRLTGLISNSSFNFSGLLHTNACLMDECKLTENQFEQWKLLASGVPMSTDVKYKDRCDVKDCVLYTCSNYPIEMYCNAPMAQQAVNLRTIQFNLKKRSPWYLRISPHTWERCWSDHGFNV